MSDKTLRAINRGRRKAGLKPIRRKKKVTEKKKVTRKMKKSDLVAGVDYYKSFGDTFGIKKKIKKNMKGHEAKGSGSWKKGAKC